MEGVHQVRPNIETHPEFGKAMEEAIEAGVEIQFLECKVTKDSLEINFSQKCQEILRTINRDSK